MNRSLTASSIGIEKANIALISKPWTQQQLAEAVSIDRQTVNKFFRGKPIDRVNFVSICEILDLNWREIIALPENIQLIFSNKNNADINSIVKEVKALSKTDIRKRCGRIRVLDMTQPISLTNIYTHVNFLEKITGRRRLPIDELLKNLDLENFDRFGLSKVTEERVPGIEAVKQQPQLMVLGSPGAGKTTFLKYLAIQCNEEHFLADQVPIFITLKNFAETEEKQTLLNYIIQRWLDLGLTEAESKVKQILGYGRGLLLLDGLDEVREEDSQRVIKEIEDFSYQYLTNYFVITCRIAAKEYTFEAFTEVEIANFDDKQIIEFAKNWFTCRKLTEQVKRFTQKLEENKPIKELANNPLLIADYIQNLSDPQASLKDLAIDSTAVLKSIEGQHGILTERAIGIYSFSHLTFQEYFTARRSVANSDNLRNLAIHVGEKRWREVFLLAVEMVQDADELVQFMKQEVDKIVDYDKKIQDFISWIDEKARLTSSPYCLISVRAFYFARACGATSSFPFIVNYKSFKDIEYARDSAKEFARYIEFEGNCMQLIEIAERFDERLYRDSSIREGRATRRMLEEDVDLDFLDVPSIEEVFLNSEEHDESSESRLQETNITNLIHELHSTLSKMVNYACPKNLELVESLQQIQDRISHISRHEWFYSRKAWLNKLRDLLTNYRFVEPDWQFSHQQKEIMNRYYNANKLLMDCLNSDCYVTRSVREKIEETLFVPIAEIEKRKSLT